MRESCFWIMECIAYLFRRMGSWSFSDVMLEYVYLVILLKMNYTQTATQPYIRFLHHYTTGEKCWIFSCIWYSIICLCGNDEQLNIFSSSVFENLFAQKSWHGFVSKRVQFSWHHLYASKIDHPDQRNRGSSQLQISFSHTSEAWFVFINYSAKLLPRVSTY